MLTTEPIRKNLRSITGEWIGWMVSLLVRLALFPLTCRPSRSKTHQKEGVYGLSLVYEDNVRANEEVRFVVDQSWQSD